MINPNYRIIGFGENEYGFFNRPIFSSNKQEAIEIYDELYAEPEIDGAVMIESLHEDWQVIYEFGTEDVEVVFTPVGTFKVVKYSGAL